MNVCGLRESLNREVVDAHKSRSSRREPFGSVKGESREVLVEGLVIYVGAQAVRGAQQQPFCVVGDSCCGKRLPGHLVARAGIHHAGKSDEGRKSEVLR